MQKYGKAIIAILAAAAVVAFQALHGDNRIEPTEAVSILIAFATAVGVYLVPMAPQAKWAKTAVAVVLALLQVASAAVLAGGLGAEEILLALITVAGALGVYVAPATSEAHGQTIAQVGVGSDV